MNPYLELFCIVLGAFVVAAAGLHDWREAWNVPNVVAFAAALLAGLRALRRDPPNSEGSQR